ncbi:22K [Aviadenovirus cerasi]|uniref:22K n=1 Tax=Fowl aviadenovirus 5 TaxID=172861 RepID=A0A6M3Z5A1_9ADEN|nr:22K [Fowl aviadenovirus 5]
MAQRMLDEKTRVTEEPPSDETAVPFPTDLRASYGVAEDTGRSIESDGETLGSQDTEEEDPLSTISEEEEEETEEAEKENVPPSRGHLERRRSASSLEKTLPRPPAKKEIPQKLVSSGNAAPGPQSDRRKPRGNYRSWVRHRVAICQALRDAVFDRKLAAEILKRVHGLFVPPTVLGYYARKLLDLTDDDSDSFSEFFLSL